MESWRKEFYGSDYGSQYLMHYRTRGSRNGISRTEGYKAIGQLAGKVSNDYEREKAYNSRQNVYPSSASVSRPATNARSTSTAAPAQKTGNVSSDYLRELASNSRQNVYSTSTSTNNRPNGRKINVTGQATGGFGRKGSVPLGETAGNFKPTGPNGLNESYAANRPTTPPSGKTAEEPKPNGLTTEEAEKLENKPAPKPMKKADKSYLLEERNKDFEERSDPARLRKLAAQRTIDEIKNEPVSSIAKDYAGIVGDVMKLMAKVTLSGYASMLAYGSNTAKNLEKSVDNDAQKLGYRIGTRIAKNRIRKGR